MENDVLSSLPPMMNEKKSFFGIGMVGGTKSYTVFVSLDKNIAVDLSIIEIAAWLISC